MSGDSAEVAEDYRMALEDLSSNMRFEISNLTVIARENTEHALAIAEVLQQHILKVGWNLDAQCVCARTIRSNANSRVGATEQETSSSVRTRLDREECRHTIHSLLRPQSLQDLYGIIRSSRSTSSPKNGGDA
jgi:hypothetical protein